jgi:hypothetical protein
MLPLVIALWAGIPLTTVCIETLVIRSTNGTITCRPGLPISSRAISSRAATGPGVPEDGADLECRRATES